MANTYMEVLTMAKRTPASAAERLWSKVDKSGGPYACWPWQGGLDHGGYGKVTIGGRKDKRTHATHRLAYTLAIGPIPAGLVIDHLCRVRHCCNPAHMEPVTQQENCQRGNTGWQAQKTHCKWGHPFDKENTRIRPGTTHRTCRACAERAQREWSASRGR